MKTLDKALISDVVRLIHNGEYRFHYIMSVDTDTNVMVIQDIVSEEIEYMSLYLVTGETEFYIHA